MVSTLGGRLPSDCPDQNKANAPQRRGLQLKPEGGFTAVLFCPRFILNRSGNVPL